MFAVILWIIVIIIVSNGISSPEGPLITGEEYLYHEIITVTTLGYSDMMPKEWKLWMVLLVWVKNMVTGRALYKFSYLLEYFKTLKTIYFLNRCCCQDKKYHVRSIVKNISEPIVHDYS